MGKSRKEKDAEYLSGPDIATCPRCGNHEHIWHKWEGDRVTASLCTKCLWHCGRTNIFQAIACKTVATSQRLRGALARREREKQG